MCRRPVVSGIASAAGCLACQHRHEWSSLWCRAHGGPEAQEILHRWPLPEPDDWLKIVNRPQTEAELTAVRDCVRKGSPFGTSQWQVRTAKRLGLEWTMRPRGRPRKKMERKCVRQNQRTKSRAPFSAP